MNFGMLLLIGLKMGRYLFIHYPTYPTFPGIADSNKKEQMKFCVYISRCLFSDFRFISVSLSKWTEFIWNLNILLCSWFVTYFVWILPESEQWDCMPVRSREQLQRSLSTLQSDSRPELRDKAQELRRRIQSQPWASAEKLTCPLTC